MKQSLRRREQRGEEPVLVGGAHHRFAMIIGVLQRQTNLAETVIGWAKAATVLSL